MISGEVEHMKFLKPALLSVLFLFLIAMAARASFISEITEMTFNSEVLECDMPVVVWFYFSESIMPNEKLSDAVDKVAIKNMKRIKVLKMDSKYNVITTKKFNIKNNNTFVIFIDGAEKARSEEIRTDKEFNAFVDQNVPK
jgi:thioredoxin-like negative regulator of GroEL